MNNAYLTFLSTDNYIYYILALNDSFRKTNSKYPLYCIVTDNVSQKTLDILDKVNLPYIKVDNSEIKTFAKTMKDINMVGKYINALSKLTIFGLNQFNKCVFLDSDLVIYKNIDDLFDKPDWSAVEDCLPVHIRPQKYKLGESSFCSGMFVFSPDIDFYNKLMKQLPKLPSGIKWHDQAILAYNNQNWMQKKELHLPCEYDLLVAAREDVLNHYLKNGGKQENIKVKHFVSHKNAPYNENKYYYFSDNVYNEYINYYKYINRIIINNNLNLPLCEFKNIFRRSEKGKERIIIKNRLTEKIDVVIAYVDSSDKNWQNIYNQYKPNNYREDVNGKTRFRGQGEFLKYLFRGIDANMSWINSIYLLVQNESEVPSWLDKSQIKVITHDKFIPKEYLPTFNSCTIEMFLWNIPNLSEKFIYLNDDFYPVGKLTHLDFYNNGKLSYKILRNTTSDTTMYDKQCANCTNLIYGNSIKGINRIAHTLRPYLKSKMIECYNKYKSQINNSISRFRSKNNYNCYIYSFYLDAISMWEAPEIKNGYLATNNSSLKIKDKLNNILNISHIVCINDGNSDINIYDNIYLNNWFESNFPYKSKYEIGYDIKYRNKPREVYKNTLNNSLIHVVSRKTVLNSNNGFTGLPDEYWKDNF